jgi:Thioredoxin
MHNYAIGVLLLAILALTIHINTKCVIWFYRPDCGHCAKMHSEWDKFERQAMFTAFPRIAPKKINVNEPENRQLSENYEISGVPHIVKLEEYGRRVVFSGERTAGELMKWCSRAGD